MSGVKIKGKVKWFNNAKGYGFINEEGKSEDLFAHYSAITMDGYKTLKQAKAWSSRSFRGQRDCMPSQFVRPARQRLGRPTTLRTKNSPKKTSPLNKISNWPDHIWVNSLQKNGHSGSAEWPFFSLPYICEINASPKPDDDTSFAPSIRRSKS
jgi:CspA family cold shock protein